MALWHSPGQLAYRVLAYGCVGIGAAGVVVPLLPTTPFLLVAGWAATRSSPRLRWWLYRHPRFGTTLRAWHRHRAIPSGAKATACLLLAISWVTLWLLGTDTRLLAGLTLFFLLVALFIVSRPSLPAGKNRTLAACHPNP